MLLARATALLAGVTLATGCPSEDDHADACAVDATTDIMLVYADALGTVHDLVDGGPVPLIPAPQGGHIVLVAPAVRSASSCTIDVNAAVRDPANNRVIGLEERPLALRAQAGWARPPATSGLADLANVAVCPTVAATTPIDGSPFVLEVAVLGPDAQPVATRTAMIVPTCDDDYCRYDCAPR